MKALNINGSFIIFQNPVEVSEFLAAVNIYDSHDCTDLESFAEHKGYGLINLSNEQDIDESRTFAALNAKIPKSRWFDIVQDENGEEHQLYDIDGYCRSEYGVSHELMRIIVNED